MQIPVLTQAIDGPLSVETVHACANMLFWQDASLYTGKDDLPYGDASWIQWRLGVLADKIEEACEWLPASVVVAYRAQAEIDDAAEIAEAV